MPSALHRVLGVALWAFFFAYFALVNGTTRETLVFGIVSFPIALIGSVIPDMDAKNSSIRKNAFGLLSIISFTSIFSFLLRAWETIYALVASIMITGVLMLLLWHSIPEHRRGIHSLRTAGVYSAFSLGVSYLLLLDWRASAMIAILGFISVFGHLALDREVKW